MHDDVAALEFGRWWCGGSCRSVRMMSQSQLGVIFIGSFSENVTSNLLVLSIWTFSCRNTNHYERSQNYACMIRFSATFAVQFHLLYCGDWSGITSGTR